MKKIYFNPQCSKCQKTLEALSGHDIVQNIETIDYTKSPFSREKLREIAAQIGVRNLIRETSPAYSEFKNRLDELSDDDILNLMTEDQSLIRRPIFEMDGFFLVGFSEENIRSILED